MTREEHLEKLKDLSELLFYKLGTDSYNERCIIYDLIESLESPNPLDQLQEELPKPIGGFILKRHTDKGVQLADGRYYHYADVCHILKDYREQHNPLDQLQKELRFYAKDKPHYYIIIDSDIVSLWIDENTELEFKSSSELFEWLKEQNKK